MIPTLYLAGTRAKRLLLFGGLPTVLVLGTAASVSIASAANGVHAPEPFLAFVVVAPAIWGLLLNSLVHEALHCQFAMTLPHAARAIIGGHALFLVGVAAAFTALTRFAAPGLPLTPVAAVCLAGLACTLPFEEGRSWTKFFGPAWILCAVILFSGPVAGWLQHWIDASPLTLTLAGLSAAAGAFATVWSKERRRTRAGSAYTSSFNALFSAPLNRRRQEQEQARKDFSQKILDVEPRRDSTRWWIAAIGHERANEPGRFGWRGTLALGILASFLAIAVPALVGRSVATFHADIMNAFGQRAGSAATTLGYFLAWQVFLAAIPRSRFLYPLSRARRLTIVYRAALTQLGIGCLMLVIGTGLVWAYVSQIVDVPVPWQSWIGLLAIASTGLIFAPVLLCARLWQDVSERGFPQILATAVTLIMGPIAIRMIWGDAGAWMGQGVPIGRLAGCAALIALSQAACYAGLRHFYRHGDLIQR